MLRHLLLLERRYGGKKARHCESGTHTNRQRLWSRENRDYKENLVMNIRMVNYTEISVVVNID